MARLYLPAMAKGLDSKKLKLHIGDGFEFLKNNENQFDVIITDSSDPEGPAEALFEASYYQLMKNALRPNGIVCCQGESLWHYADLIEKILKFAGDIYPSVSYAHGQTPTYPSGIIGYIICSLEEVSSLAKKSLFKVKYFVILNTVYRISAFLNRCVRLTKKPLKKWISNITRVIYTEQLLFYLICFLRYFLLLCLFFYHWYFIN